MSVSKAAVGTDVVVMESPSLDRDDGLAQAVEDLLVQELVAELAVEGFAVTIFLGTARLDV